MYLNMIKYRSKTIFRSALSYFKFKCYINMALRGLKERVNVAVKPLKAAYGLWTKLFNVNKIRLGNRK